MVDRDVFDEWLRARAAANGAERRTGMFTRLDRDTDGTAIIRYNIGGSRHGSEHAVRAKMVIGADGALSQVARQTISCADKAEYVFAYHEVVASPAAGDAFDHRIRFEFRAAFPGVGEERGGRLNERLLHLAVAEGYG
jgi:geranylgeranyl reductase